jgi:ornithine cyclodeaminase
MEIYTQQQIMASLNLEEAASRVAEGFVAYTQGLVQVPPVQSFQFASRNGDCCVKSAWILEDELFSVRISAGFYDNPAKGLPSNDGLTLLISAHTGRPVAMLRDEGWLTSMRTALAGQIVARAMAPTHVTGIGIVGTGTQARLQLEHLMPVTECRSVTVFGRDPQRLKGYREFAESLGFKVTTTEDAAVVAMNANLIVTATASREAIIMSDWVRPGTHITALGADGYGKQELDVQLVARADVIVVDSADQCIKFGEIAQAVASRLIEETSLVALGSVLSGERRGRLNDQQITIADLTGLGVQDTQIAKCAVAACSRH